MYFTGVGRHSMMLQLDGPEQVEWDHGVWEIKHIIETISESSHDDAARRPLYLKWREMVLSFAAKWGWPRVPLDIKEALQSVENGVGLPITNW